MVAYYGYGFDSNRLSNASLLSAMRKLDQDTYKDFLEDVQDNEGNTDEETLLRCIEEYLEERGLGGIAEYICELINSEEGLEAVNFFESYVVFEPVPFLDDCPRAKKYPDRQSFITMVGKYLPLNELTFKSLYEGCEWSDPVYFMEE